MIIMMNNLKSKKSEVYNYLAYLQIGSADEEWNMNVGIFKRKDFFLRERRKKTKGKFHFGERECKVFF